MTISDSSDNHSFYYYINQLNRRLINIITDLRLAIILLLAIALFSITGTVIEQDQTIEFYQENYPENPALFGFLTWKFILMAGLDDVYVTWWFVSLLVLFGSSLIACTFKRQLPALKAAQKWNFYRKSKQFKKLALSTEIDQGSVKSLPPLLKEKNYKIFEEENIIYARKGIVGRIGPIIVHIGIIIILLGSILGAFTGFLAQEMIPSGDTFKIKNIVEAGILSSPKKTKDFAIKVNRFWIKYTPDGKVDQFYSDLSVINENEEELKRKTIFVNQPLRYNGITFYQTNWDISGIKVRVNNSPIFKLPMMSFNTENNGRLWGTWIPTKTDLSEGVTLITQDLQGTMFVYDTQGNLVSAVRPEMPIQINGVTLKIVELIGATGLQIKSDPGVIIVYLGFALLMIGVIMSYISYSQIWALQEGDRFYIGGKTNRAKVIFEQELIDIIEKIKS